MAEDKRKRIIELLRKLEDLKNVGALTQEEYEKKRMLLQRRLEELESMKPVPKPARPLMLIALILLSVVAAISIGACLYLNQQYGNLSSDYIALQNSYNQLQANYNQLQSTYNELQGAYAELRSQHSRLEEKYNTVMEENRKLNQDLARLTSEYEALSSSYNDLKQKFESVSSEYAQLREKYLLLQNDFQNLQRNYESLQSSYRELEQSAGTWKSKYDQLLQDYNALKAKYESLQEKVNELEEKVNELEYLLRQYEKVPHNYYETNYFASNGTAKELKGILRQAHDMLSRDYKAGVFDCSESAAFIEWVLEDAGYDAYIAVGPAPWDPKSGYHAWVIAYTRDGYVAAVECTITTSSRIWLELELLDYGIIYGNDPNAKGYYEGYDYLFKNIYQAIRYFGAFEWNWWEGYWGFT